MKRITFLRNTLIVIAVCIILTTAALAAIGITPQEQYKGCILGCKDAKLLATNACNVNYHESRLICQDFSDGCYEDIDDCKSLEDQSDTAAVKECKSRMLQDRKDCRADYNICNKATAAEKSVCYTEVRNDDTACRQSCKNGGELPWNNNGGSSDEPITCESEFIGDMNACRHANRECMDALEGEFNACPTEECKAVVEAEVDTCRNSVQQCFATALNHRNNCEN